MIKVNMEVLELYTVVKRQINKRRAVEGHVLNGAASYGITWKVRAGMVWYGIALYSCGMVCWVPLSHDQ